MIRGNTLARTAAGLVVAALWVRPVAAQAPEEPQPPPAQPQPSEGAPPDAAAAVPDEGDEASPEADREARELFRRGDAHYAKGEFAEALANFREAYALSERPALLYNMANALEKLGREAEALSMLEAYAEHQPGGPGETLQQRIAKLRAKLFPPEPEPAPEPAPAPPLPAPQPAPALRPAPVPAASPPTRTEPDSPAERPAAIAGYVGIGLGVISFGIGGALGGLALSARSDAEASCRLDADQRYCLEEASKALDDDVRFSGAADALFGVGAALALLGGGLVIYSFVSAGGEAAEVSLVSGPAGSEARALVRF